MGRRCRASGKLKPPTTRKNERKSLVSGGTTTTTTESEGVGTSRHGLTESQRALFSLDDCFDAETDGTHQNIGTRTPVAPHPSRKSLTHGRRKTRSRKSDVSASNAVEDTLSGDRRPSSKVPPPRATAPCKPLQNVPPPQLKDHLPSQPHFSMEEVSSWESESCSCVDNGGGSRRGTSPSSTRPASLLGTADSRANSASPSDEMRRRAREINARIEALRRDNPFLCQSVSLAQSPASLAASLSLQRRCGEPSAPPETRDEPSALDTSGNERVEKDWSTFIASPSPPPSGSHRKPRRSIYNKDGAATRAAAAAYDSAKVGPSADHADELGQKRFAIARELAAFFEQTESESCTQFTSRNTSHAPGTFRGSTAADADASHRARSYSATATAPSASSSRCQSLSQVLLQRQRCEVTTSSTAGGGGGGPSSSVEAAPPSHVGDDIIGISATPCQSVVSAPDAAHSSAAASADTCSSRRLVIRPLQKSEVSRLFRTGGENYQDI